MKEMAVGSGVMLALLPVTTEWCKIEVPHMTLVYAGKTEDLTDVDRNELTKDASALAMISRPVYLRVTGLAQFGGQDEDNPPVDVFTLLPSPELWAMRRTVESWNASEHPFRPHVTIGPAGSWIENYEMRPRTLAFDRLCVGWGEEYITFNLRG